MPPTATNPDVQCGRRGLARSRGVLNADERAPGRTALTFGPEAPVVPKRPRLPARQFRLWFRVVAECRRVRISSIGGHGPEGWVTVQPANAEVPPVRTPPSAPDGPALEFGNGALAMNDIFVTVFVFLSLIAWERWRVPGTAETTRRGSYAAPLTNHAGMNASEGIECNHSDLQHLQQQ